MTFWLALASGSVKAQTYNALKECSAISQDLNDIHACMDDYLDVLDGNLAEMSELLSQTLQGDALVGLTRSQQAFVEYRRENCLWYLEFSSPRSDAEQIAKNCLAAMSQQRLNELTLLLSDDSNANRTVSGLYIFTASDKYIQLCGSEDRFWIEATSSVETEAQQIYTSLSGDFSQPLFGVFTGNIVENGSVPDGYQGLFRLEAIDQSSVSPSATCESVVGDSPSAFDALSGTDDVLTGINDVEELDLSSQEEPQQQLIAYFGAWLVDCTENDGVRACRLSVDLEEPNLNKPLSVDGERVPKLTLLRLKQQASLLELSFPGVVIDSISDVKWRIDGLSFGEIANSEMVIDEGSTRQIVPASRFLRNELLPMMIDGNQVTIQASIDQPVEGQKGYQATLQGLTKSLAFADEFVIDSVN